MSRQCFDIISAICMVSFPLSFIGRFDTNPVAKQDLIIPSKGRVITSSMPLNRQHKEFGS